eukprot:TRINITY_DN5333_c0_g2_i1.p1 TRINITY_DN5333_c0_g2~~TRINITY_DN5333_c0_g2_i1.p1  ORF type:complete len:104 (+),score=14.68 TRINITY_DN5333_c0_g2_i1:210-521(+)
MLHFIVLESQISIAVHGACLDDIVQSVKLIKETWKIERLLLYNKCKEMKGGNKLSYIRNTTVKLPPASIPEAKSERSRTKSGITKGKRRLSGVGKSYSACSIF